MCFIIGFSGKVAARKTLRGVDYVTLKVIFLGHQIINAMVTSLITILSFTTGMAKVPSLKLVLLCMVKESVRW